jgi:zinc protease
MLYACRICIEILLEATMKTRYLFGAVLFFVLFMATLSGVDLSAPIPMDPDLRYGKLDNGFTYYIKYNRMPQKRAELKLFVRGGSVQEDDDQRGLAHFGEHMAFNGTAHFPKQELLDYLNSIGFGFQGGLNGGTSYDFVVYQLQVPTDDMEAMDKGFLILSDWSHAISFEPEEIDKERGVIMEEYRGGLSAWERCYRKINAAVYQGSRYADRMPIGDPDIIQNAPYEALTRFYTDWYHPANLAIAAVGDFDPDAIEAIIRKYFGPIPAKENPRPLGVFPLAENIEPQAVVAADPEMNMTMLNLRWKHPVASTGNLGEYLEALKTNIFCQMLGDRFTDRSDAEFSPFSYGYAYKGNQGNSFAEFDMVFIAPPDSVLATLNYGLDELKRIQKYGFTATELDRAKRSILRSLENSVAEDDKQESDDMVWEYFSHFLRGNPASSPAQNLEIIRSLLDLVTLDEVNAIHAKLVTDKNMVLTLMTSERPGIATITEEQILAAVAQNRATNLIEYEDIFRDEPLLTEIPKGGRVVKEQLFAKTGIKCWTLSNGAKVYIKPTDFKNDELQLRAFSYGGLSLCADADYIHADLAASLANDCGVGAFNRTELNKKLADQIVWIYPWIDRTQEGFQGECSPQDLETMFQLIYLYSTAPNFTQQSYRSWFNKQSTSIRDRALDPEECFQDSLSYLSRDRHPRSKPTCMQDLEAFDPQIAARIFRERFANLGDFQWVFVGNFDEAILKRFCEIYLGNSIPGAKPESVRDDGMRYRQGKHNFELRKGIADRAVVRVVNHGYANATPEARTQMNLAGMLAGEKLRENIRENRSGVYYVGCYANISLDPVPETIGFLYMGCSTERVDELLDASFATLDSLEAGIFDDKYVNTVRQSSLKRLESDLQRNQWWADQIRACLQNRLPVNAILDEMEIINTFDRDYLIDGIRKYYNFDTNCQRFVLYPEKQAEADSGE